MLAVAAREAPPPAASESLALKVVGVAAVLIAAAWASRSISQQGTAPVSLMPVQRANAYPAIQTQAFMNACTQRGTAPLVCSCVLTGLEQRYPFEDYVRMETALMAGQPWPEPVVDVMSKCRLESAQR